MIPLMPHHCVFLWQMTKKMFKKNCLNETSELLLPGSRKLYKDLTARGSLADHRGKGCCENVLVPAESQGVTDACTQVLELTVHLRLN